MIEVVIMSCSHKFFSLLLVCLVGAWLFALAEAQKKPPECNQLGRIQATNSGQTNGTCGIVNLTNIEVCEEDGWRGICDADFTENDARVVCRELNYSDVGAIAESLQQSVGGFPTTKSPSCVGTESLLSECSIIPIMLSGECMATKVLVRCYMSGADTSECGISTQPPSSVNTDSPTTVPFTSTSESAHHDGPTTSVQFPDTTSSDSTEHITSTQNPSSGTSQQNRSNLPTLPIILAVSVVAVVVCLVAIMCVVLVCVLYRRSRKEKNFNDQVCPDSPVKVRKSDETDSKDVEAGMYSELNNTVVQHQVPIYDTVKNKSQNLSEVSASESNDDHHTYALLDQDAIYTQIGPHMGSPNKSSTLPAGLSGVQASLYYQKLDHTRSLPRSTGQSNDATFILTHAVNRTALALESGNINETDLVSPTASDSSARFASPRGSPKQHHASSQSSTSKEEAPLITDPTDAGMENYYHILDPEVASSSADQDIVSQASTDAVCNQQVMDSNSDNRHAQCQRDYQQGMPVEGAVYAIIDPSTRAQQHGSPSRQDMRQRSQSSFNNRSPPQQQRVRSNSAKRNNVRGAAGLQHTGQRVVAPPTASNKISQLSGNAEFSSDPQMDTLV